ISTSLRQTTLSEYVFAFDCDTDNDNKKVMIMLDMLMRKVQSDELQVNCLSRNTLEDVLADKLMAQDAQLQEDDLRKLSQVQIRKASTSWDNQSFRLMLWKHLLIAYRSPGIFIWACLGTFALNSIPFLAEHFILRVGTHYRLSSLIQTGFI